MADATEHGETVLAAIIPGRRDLLERAERRLSPEHFVDRNQRKVFQLLLRYAAITGTVMPLKHIEDLALKSNNKEQAALLVEVYTYLAEKHVDETDFHWSIQELRDHTAELATSAALSNAMAIIRRGVPDEVTGETKKGQADAREYLGTEMSRIDRDLKMAEISEGSIHDEEKELLVDYAENKKAFHGGKPRGINFGIDVLDEKAGGIQRGDFILLAGYTSDGKTTLAVQLAWSAAVEQGKNVVFFTTETLRQQVRRKIVARHSSLPIFGLKQGLNTKHIKAGTLSAEHEAVYEKVVKDITNNPSYGKLFISQVPRGGSVTSLESRLNDLNRKFEVDLVIMDYLALLSSDRKRQSQREELSSIMKEAKQVATTFNDSQGVPFVSPWQVSREARVEAEKLGQYTTRALSETAEATNSADMIISLFAPPDLPDPRHAEVSVQLLKNRDGEKSGTLPVEVDYASCTFSSKGAPKFSAALGGNSSRFGRSN